VPVEKVASVMVTGTEAAVVTVVMAADLAQGVATLVAKWSRA